MLHGTTIDWLSYTIKWEHLQPDNWSLMTDAHSSASYVLGLPNAWNIEKGLHSYRYTLVNREVDGVRVMVSEPHSPMGVHIQYSGSALRALDIDFVMGRCVHWQGKPTRVDLALDVLGKVDILDCVVAWEMGNVITRAKQYAHIRSGTGETFYVGARTSDRYLRIYDKGAQMGKGDEWTRIEIECKRDLAEMAFHGYRLYGGGSVREKIQSFCDFPKVQWWVDAMNSQDTAESLPKPSKSRNTRKWLMDAVVPSLARECELDVELLQEFIAAVINKRREMQEYR
jgi:hypothetical protein